MKHLFVVLSFLLTFLIPGAWAAADESALAGGPSAANQPGVWIAVRTDGMAGSGTASDPFDGSTAAKFDGLMKAAPPRMTIHLAAGLFPTTGAAAYHLKTGWKICGAGMGQTTLRLTGFDHHSGKSEVLSTLGESDGVEIHDLTIDGNYAAIRKLPGWIAGDAVCAIYVFGGNTLVENVETIHLYGDGTKHLEEFSILLSGTDRREVRNCRIIHCLTHRYAITPEAGSSAFGPAIAFCDGGLVLNCTDDGALHGFGGIGRHMLIQGNTTTTNTSVGWYNDTATLHDFTLIDNHFGASKIPLQWNNPKAGSSHIRILHNTFTTATNFSYGIATAAIRLDQGGLSDVLIQDNHVIYTGRGNYQFITNGCRNTGLTIEDNGGTATDGGSVFLSYHPAELTIGGNIVAHNHFRPPAPGLAHP
jgi:hypothetical protein